MKDANCMYCVENQTLRDLMIEVTKVGPYTLYLHRNQSYPGRCILAYKDHVRCVDEMNSEDCQEYFAAVQKVAAAIKKVFAPHQINLATFGDLAGHVHCHLVPKYEGGLDFGGMFQMNPEPGEYLSEQEYADRIEKLRAALA
jgi:Diadenosine tetraphosphate (Ap4A) hydrolase and other HIT family hydrolases